MGFEQGLSGLNAASTQLDVIGNNIANSSTVGFKPSVTQFSDVFANSLTGAGALQVGIGAQVATVSQQFTQGNIVSTNNPLDVAINGNGFFRMSSGGSISYTRNGQFQLDKNGNIVNSSGAMLTGYAVTANGSLNTGAAVPLNINTSDLAPKQTSAITAALNLNSTNSIPTSAVFSPTDSNSFNSSTSLSVFDSLGNSHTLQVYFAKTGPVPPATGEGTWNVYATDDGTPVTSVAPLTGGQIGTLAFQGNGSLDPATTTPVTSPLYNFSVPIGVTTGANTPFTANISFANTTQYGSGFSVNSLTQNGYTAGQLSKFNIGADGTITGSYSNGQSSVLGQVVMANFTNPNGLQSAGGNQWTETATSGPPLVGTPTSGGLGTLQSSATESSQTDLTGSLVNLIQAQQNYQANAQTIKTQDSIMQTLVNLR